MTGPPSRLKKARNAGKPICEKKKQFVFLSYIVTDQIHESGLGLDLAHLCSA